jgi:serine/threonine protein kinase
MWKVFFDLAEASPEEIERRLPVLCNGDADLQQQVRKLLTASHTTSPLDNSPLENISLPEQDTDLSGMILNNRFELVEHVASGGMSAVYKALDRRRIEAHDRNPYVAVKILNTTFSMHTRAMTMLQRETRKSQTLAHPNIVRVFDFDRDGDLYYMTMELLDGQSLADRMTQGPPMREKAALRVIHQIGLALAFAHQNKIVHADLKPGNVLIDIRGKAKVIDFGIARTYRSEADTGVTTTVFDAATIGAMTPGYASPEMLNGEDVDPRDDLFALGCISYEMLTGEHPYNALWSTAAAAQNLKLVRNGLRWRHWRALKKALMFERDKRHASVGHFLNALGMSAGAEL